MTTAFITGISGQDGSYLTELLLEKGYGVTGLTRSVERARHGFLAPHLGAITLVEGSLDLAALRGVLARLRPDEIYHLGGPSSVGASWDDPVGTGDACGLGTVRLLEAVRLEAPRARLFNASSCEIFAPEAPLPLSESSPRRPASPYGAAKLYAHHAVAAWRGAYGLYAVNGILFNHESPRRSSSFVSRRIVQGVARIRAGEARELRLGSLDAARDWGFAGDAVRAMWLMLQSATPEDLVVGTGQAHSVREFCDAAFAAAGLDYRQYVVSDPARLRVFDAPLRLADPSRARDRLGWTPQVDFGQLVRLMVSAEPSAAESPS